MNAAILKRFSNITFASASVWIQLLLLLFSASPTCAQTALQSAAIYQQAEQVYKSGHVLAARNMMQAILQDPKAKPTPEVYCLFAETFLGDLEQSEANRPAARAAEQGLLQAVKLDPQCGRAYKDLANFCNCRGDYNQAVIYSTKALEVKRPDARGFLHRSMAYSHLKEPEKALTDMNQFILKGKPQPLHYMLRGDILMSLGRYADAVPDYRKAAKGNTGFQILILHKIIACLEKEGKYAEAIIDLTAWLNGDKENAQIFALRGHLKKEIKDYKAAIDDYSHAIDLEPTAKFFKDRAELYTLTGNAAMAAKDLRSADN